LSSDRFRINLVCTAKTHTCEKLLLQKELIHIKPGLINLMEVRNNIWAWKRIYLWDEIFALFPLPPTTEIIQINSSPAIYELIWKTTTASSFEILSFFAYISYSPFRERKKWDLELKLLGFKETRRNIYYLVFFFFLLCVCGGWLAFCPNEIFSFLKEENASQ